MDAKKLNEAVASAKAAVSDLQEPLKTEAFKIILNKLISSASDQISSEEKEQRGRREAAQPKRLKGTFTKRASGTAQQASSLKFEVDVLRRLKTYCEQFDLKGTEQIAFVLANFLREHTDLKVIRTPDIAYCYRQLVSQKVKVPAVNDIADWSRALMWLTAPSRKKEWLEKQDDGYAVSNAGLLRFNELEAQKSIKHEQ